MSAAVAAEWSVAESKWTAEEFSHFAFEVKKEDDPRDSHFDAEFECL